jgi:phage regulator Rha-like protein
MNQIVNINTTSTLTMSSREIAELTGKQHKHVIRDIVVMFSDLEGVGSKSGLNDFLGSYIAENGKRNPEYHLPKRETLILVSGYSIELRARIIDRWMELEEEASSAIGRGTETEVTVMVTQYATRRVVNIHNYNLKLPHP